MSLESVLPDLQQKYNCSEPLYLSNFFKPNGEKWLYDKLKQLYQPVYENNYRLLLIQDCSEVYNFADLPGLAITAIQKYASQLDISNCFILIVTSNQNIKQDLEKARTLYSTDTRSIQHYLVEGLPIAVNPNIKQDTFCVLPPRHKQRLEQIINHHIVWCEGNSAIKLATQWKDVLTYMWSKDNSHCLSEFRRLTNLMDVYRKESLAKAIPELADLIEENIL